MNPQPLIDQCARDLDPVDAVAEYEATLRKQFSFSAVGGPFVDMNPSTVLREIDPIQYQIGLNKLCQRRDYVKLGNHYYDHYDAQDVAERVARSIRGQADSLRREQGQNPADHDVLAVRIAMLEIDAQEIETFIQ